MMMQVQGAACTSFLVLSPTMALCCTLHLPFLLVVSVISLAYVHGVQAEPFRRSSFPAGFVFGTASAAYQYEGAAKEGGRGPSIWDVYTHEYPNRIKNGSNGDVAIDFYHKYKEDVKLMKEMGLDAFRLSISWSRVLPKGRLSGGVNKAGINYYNNLINELLSNGIKPFITLFHWDTPQTFEDQFGGFLSPKIVPHFRDFAEVCFKEFGDRVKHWITLNEPWTYSVGGYALGNLAPGRCSQWFGDCTAGDSATEPYLVAHHLLLSHAAAVKVYKDKYQASQKGLIGITLVSHWMVPASSSPANVEAARRAMDFMYGWYMEPLTKGKYPSSMRSLVGSRLPKFTKEQSDLLKGSFDFIGLNYYTSNYASKAPPVRSNSLSYSTDSRSNLSGVRNGIPIGRQAASSWLYIYPQGMKEVLMYTKNKYGNPLVYITENGVSEFNNASWSLKEALQDDVRRDYYHRHLQQVQLAVKDGANVKGYFAWSLLDNFEWGDGYTIRFGINYVDYNNGLKRYRKKSSYWFENFLKD